RRGVHLLTLHGAKGLEFDAVFLPRVEERELPVRQARSEREIVEERRLLYVGITRARRDLAITWTRPPSRFLTELGLTRPAADEAPAGFDELKAWRLARARVEDVPAFVVF